MEGTTDHGEGGALEAGLSLLELEAHPLDERLLGDPLPLVGGIERSHLAERPAMELLPGVVTGRREVGQQVVVAGDTRVGGRERVEGDDVLDVLIGSSVDRSSHPATLCGTTHGPQRSSPSERPGAGVYPALSTPLVSTKFER